MADKITVLDVTARDGLQNETRPCSTDDKVTLIAKLVDAGVKNLQITSFVHPKWVPQMSDAEALVTRLRHFEGVCFSALIPNMAGYDRATSVGLKNLEFVISASETFNKRNLNRSIAESIELLEQVTRNALRDGVVLRVGVSTSFHCPFEGWISSRALLGVLRTIRERVPWRIAICDTDGMAFPLQVREATGRIQDELQIQPAELALHFHDTYGRAIANALVGLDAGVREFDATAAGLGGCPYCPGASGNLSTEDLVEFVHLMNYETGIDIDKLLDAAEYAHRFSSRPYQGHLLRARR